MFDWSVMRHPQHPGMVPDYRTMEPGKVWVFLGETVMIQLPTGKLILDFVVAIMTVATTYEVPIVVTHNGYKAYEDEVTYLRFRDDGWEMYQKLNGLVPPEQLVKTGWLVVPEEPTP